MDIPDSLRLFLPKEIAETGVELSHLQPITSPEEYEEPPGASSPATATRLPW